MSFRSLPLTPEEVWELQEQDRQDVEDEVALAGYGIPRSYVDLPLKRQREMKAAIEALANEKKQSFSARHPHLDQRKVLSRFLIGAAALAGIFIMVFFPPFPLIGGALLGVLYLSGLLIGGAILAVFAMRMLDKVIDRFCSTPAARQAVVTFPATPYPSLVTTPDNEMSVTIPINDTGHVLISTIAVDPDEQAKQTEAVQSSTARILTDTKLSQHTEESIVSAPPAAPIPAVVVAEVALPAAVSIEEQPNKNVITSSSLNIFNNSYHTQVVSVFSDGSKPHWGEFRV